MCQCNPTQLLQIVNAVEQYEAKQRIPPEHKGTSFFSAFDLWQYIAITDDRTCKYCMDYDRNILFGTDLRLNFPDLEIINDDQILPRLHMTLWGADTCRCTILRVTDLSDYITYTEPIPEFPSVKYTEPNKLPRINPDYIRGQTRTTTLDDLGIELVEKKKHEKST
jgi:hypothetical protein